MQMVQLWVAAVRTTDFSLAAVDGRAESDDSQVCKNCISNGCWLLNRPDFLIHHWPTMPNFNGSSNAVEMQTGLHKRNI